MTVPALSHPFGLYLHVPYCAALCPYCDFAKTANFTADIQQRYLAQLAAHLRAWTTLPVLEQACRGGFSSVFFGGGTPSLFAEEYRPLFAEITPLLQQGAEVSLEANPDDISGARLATWRELGFNRLSMGVQTFQPEGLTVLKRLHSGALAQQAIDIASAAFPTLNIDLIYGWPGQTLAAWEADLAIAIAHGVPHLSLYSLTYEGRTPLARLALRGRIRQAGDDHLADLYSYACARLSAAGYHHEEVSNWSLPGAACQHNWLYWQDHSFIGIGAGAHGYLASPQGAGLRYAYDRSDRAFNKRPLAVAASASLDARTLVSAFGIIPDETRDLDAWLTELIGAGLRTRQGIALEAALKRCEMVLQPTPVLHEGINRGLLAMEAGQMRLVPDEWFREAGWGVELLRSCVSRSHLGDVRK